MYYPYDPLLPYFILVQVDEEREGGRGEGRGQMRREERKGEWKVLLKNYIVESLSS